MRRSLIIGTSLTLLATVIVGQAYSQNSDLGFEALPACGKLNAIAGSGKSVVDYIMGSGFDQFAADVVTNCPRHLVSLGQSWEIVAARDGRMFDQLSPCEQLNAVERDEKSVTDFIVNSDYNSFAQPVLENCPRHLENLGRAWQRLNPIQRGNDATPFERLSRCQQLDVIDSTTGKSVVDHIFGSGIETYEFAVRNECNRHLEALEEAIRQAQRTTVLPVNTNVVGNIAVNLSFESLAPCQKLDVVQGEGKSVPRYIAGSGINDFAPDIYSMCTRHIGNLIEAEKIIATSPLSYAEVSRHPSHPNQPM